MTYAVSVEPANASLLRHLGRLFHIGGGHKPLALSWSEPGPEQPATLLRSVRLNLPELDPGRYRVRLDVRLPGRSTLTSETVFEVVPR